MSISVKIYVLMGRGVYTGDICSNFRPLNTNIQMRGPAPLDLGWDT